MMLTRELGFKILAGGVLLGLVAFAVWFVAIRPGQLKEEAAKAKGEATSSQGQVKAGSDAARITSENAQAKGNIDKETRDAVEELVATPEERRDAVAVARLCMSNAYRDTPSCVQLRKLRP